MLIFDRGVVVVDVFVLLVSDVIEVEDVVFLRVDNDVVDDEGIFGVVGE